MRRQRERAAREMERSLKKSNANDDTLSSGAWRGLGPFLVRGVGAVLGCVVASCPEVGGDGEPLSNSGVA